LDVSERRVALSVQEDELWFDVCGDKDVNVIGYCDSDFSSDPDNAEALADMCLC
jgi:hypothetical protein